MSFFTGLVDNVKRHRRAWITGGAVAVVVIGGGIGFWNWHNQPQFCAICHPMDPYYESFISSDYMANLHAQSDVDCLACHEPTISQQMAELWSFITGGYETPLPEIEYATEDCLGCHMDNSSHKSWGGGRSSPSLKTTPWLVNTITIMMTVFNPTDTQWDCYSCTGIHEGSTTCRGRYRTLLL